jgi:uncharacterized protein (TIRG00374 family)
MKRSNRHLWLVLGQFIITIALLLVLFRSIDWISLHKLIAYLHWGYVTLCAVLFLICHLLNVLRWKYITATPGISIGTFIRYYGIGLFSNNFLPTGFGGDAVRAALLGSKVSLPFATLSVTLDRGMGLLSLSVLLFVGLWFGAPPGLVAHLQAPLPDDRVVLALGIIAVCVLAATLLWRSSPALHALISRLKERLRKRFAVGRDEKLVKRLLGRCPGAYAISALSNICLALAYWCALFALGQTVPPGAAAWLLCVASLALLVPVTVNGLGLQEGIFVVVLSHYGVTAAAALGVALLLRLLGIMYSGLGSIFVLHTPLRQSTHDPSGAAEAQSLALHRATTVRDGDATN